MSARSKVAGIRHLLDTRTKVTVGSDAGKHSGANPDTVIKVLDVLQDVVEELTPVTLDGATNEPAPGTWTLNAGEFAAKWNVLTPAERERYWEYIRDAQQRSPDCVVKDHDGLEQQNAFQTEAIAKASRAITHAKSELQGLLDSLDSHITQDEIYSAIKTVKEAL